MPCDNNTITVCATTTPQVTRGIIMGHLVFALSDDISPRAGRLDVTLVYLVV